MAEVWTGNIEKETTSNANFRTEVWTGDRIQLTVMSLKQGEEIGWEKHDDTDQFIRVEAGSARVETGSERGQASQTKDVSDDWAAIIPAGVWHNVVNTGDAELKLYSIYSPPEHPAGTVHATKAESDAAEAEHDH